MPRRLRYLHPTPPARVRLTTGPCALGLAATRMRYIAVEDVALALCDYGQGNVGWFYATTAEMAGADRLEVIGERGALVWEQGRGRQLSLEPPLPTHLRTSPELFGQPLGAWRERRWRRRPTAR
jgi:hypothetical protein